MSNFMPSNGGLPLTVTNPGRTFYVNSSTVLAKNGVGGVSGAPGTYTRPVATIAQALDLCLADRGDVIFVMPGYTEAVIVAAGLVLDVDGVALVGLGSGSLKPTITLSTAATADINITASNTSVYNFRFVSAAADTTNCLHITGGDVTIDSCEFMASAAANAFLTSITSSNTAFGLTVKNNVFNMESDVVGVSVTQAATQAISFDGDNTTIIDNSIAGNFTVTGILNVTTLAEGALVGRNQVYNISTTASAGGISVKTGTSGMCFDNRVCVLDADAVATIYTNKSLQMFRNEVMNAVAESSIVFPETAST